MNDDLQSVGTEDALRFATLNEQCANAWRKSSEPHKFRMDTGRTIRALVSERDALAGRVGELEGALGFYADTERYHGPNQRQVRDKDPFTPEDAVYIQDVTRDRGDIARAALASKEQP